MRGPTVHGSPRPDDESSCSHPSTPPKIRPGTLSGEQSPFFFSPGPRRLTLVADQSGRIHEISTHKRAGLESANDSDEDSPNYGGHSKERRRARRIRPPVRPRQTADYRNLDTDSIEADQSDDTPTEEILIRIWLDVISYVSSEERPPLTIKQQRTVIALLILRMSLQEFARLEHTSPAAIEARIRGLEPKLPKVVQWWDTIHQARKRKR